jgi:DNA-binding CsgD family transcriptional regulator
VLVRNVVETARRTRKHAALGSGMDVVDEKGIATLERSVVSGRYFATASAALEEACNALPEGLRRVLLLRYEEGLALADIARLRRIHESTVIRHIQEAQAHLRLSTRRALARSGLSSPAISECIHDLLYNPRYSLLAALKRANRNGPLRAGCVLSRANDSSVQVKETN